MSDYLRNLFQLGQATHQPAFVRRDVLGWISDQGRVAVVRCTLNFCPHTDATLPTPSRRLETTADSLEQARAIIADLDADNEGGDEWYEVRDLDGIVHEPQPTPAPAFAGFGDVDAFDDVPF